jgi:hypothetical protein
MQASALLGDRNPLGPQIRAFCGDNTSAFTNDIQKGVLPHIEQQKNQGHSVISGSGDISSRQIPPRRRKRKLLRS